MSDLIVCEEGAHVGRVCIHEHGVRAQHVAGRLRRRQCVGVDEQCLGRRLLHVHDRTDLRGDLRLDVVALVEHERHAGAGIQPASPPHLPHDAEELERIGRTDHEVVVGVEAGVEVEAAQLPGPQEDGHDELDVRARRVVSRVDDDLRLRSELDAVRVRRAPVGTSIV